MFTDLHSETNGLLGKIACVIDTDNLLHRGFDKQTRRARPQAQLDAVGLTAALRGRGVSTGTICRNWSFSDFAARFWAGLGFCVAATRTNCDERVKAEGARYAEQGCQGLVLVSGDGDYCDMVRTLRSKSVFVEVWARRANASTKLVGMADRVRYIDEFILPSVTFDNDEVRRIWAPQFGIRGDRAIPSTTVGHLQG